MKCDKCGENLKKISRSVEMDELDDDATEGQSADYFASLESGDVGDWGYGEIEYYCNSCQSSMVVIMETLNDLNSLIKGWHAKAGEQEDYFSKYVFEYLSFVAHLKNNLFTETQDRRAIQELKMSASLRENYFEAVSKSSELTDVWMTTIEELKLRPLHNSSHDFDFPEIDRWWNSSGYSPSTDIKLKKGIIHDITDWQNMVEYWVAVRNNLFHGGKNPNLKRDQFLVKNAYLTMSPFMDYHIQRLK